MINNFSEVFLGMPLTKYRTNLQDSIYEYNVFYQRDNDILLFEKLVSSHIVNLNSKIDRDFFIKDKDILIKTMQPFNVTLFYKPEGKIIIPLNYIVIRLKPKSKISSEEIWTLLNNQLQSKFFTIMNTSAIKQGVLSISHVKALLSDVAIFLKKENVEWKLFLLLARQKNLYKKKAEIIEKRNKYYMNYQFYTKGKI